MADPIRLVVHGHFYQPPRENPWTEEVPVEAGAAPFHDWNERITHECYRPNGWARVVDEHGLVRDVVDNYSYLSFNVGPTLLSWLHAHHPDVEARMVGADTAGGGAIAQAYNHLILPLASDRDVRTQVRWGLADFAHRFGRSTTAMWLPETAVDERVLAVLVEEGIEAVILAPGQAHRVKPLGADDGQWADVDGATVSSGVPHRWFHPDGQRSLALVFYDGPLSHDLAFSLSGLSSEALVNRVRTTAADGTPVVVAADGETFGHHHKYADRALAYAFAHEAPANDVEVRTLAELLDEVPATHEVRVHQSSWSCAHGVGRWKEDCGCQTGGEPDWDQAWRAPLREALDLLRDHGIEVFERRGGAVFADRWAARDAYVAVLLGAVGPEDFAARHAPDADPVEVLTLLEAQRQAMLMYTSCGWFFNDLAGIETVQVLRYAARLLDLLGELGEEAPLDDFLAVLGQARSNRPEEGSGVDVWHRHVTPSRVDAGRVVAHIALLDLLERRDAPAKVGGHDIEGRASRHRRTGTFDGVAGEVALVHARTRRRSTHVYAAVRVAGLDVVGAVREADPARDGAAVDELLESIERGDRVSSVLRVIDRGFGPREFGLDAALPDAAGDIVASAANGLADRFASTLEALWADNRAVLASLAIAGHPLEAELKAPVEHALGRRIRTALATANAADVEVAEAAAGTRAALDAAWEARRLGVDLGQARLGGPLSEAVEAAVRRAVGAGGDGDEAALVRALLDLRRVLGIGIDLDRSQELLVAAIEAEPGSDRLRALAGAVGVAVDPL